MTFQCEQIWMYHELPQLVPEQNHKCWAGYFQPQPGHSVCIVTWWGWRTGCTAACHILNLRNSDFPDGNRALTGFSLTSSNVFLFFGAKSKHCSVATVKIWFNMNHLLGLKASINCYRLQNELSLCVAVFFTQICSFLSLLADTDFTDFRFISWEALSWQQYQSILRNWSSTVGVCSELIH